MLDCIKFCKLSEKLEKVRSVLFSCKHHEHLIKQTSFNINAFPQTISMVYMLKGCNKKS